MKILFNLKKIESLISNFYQLTNLVISFCDTTFTHITSSDHLSSFCSCIANKYSKHCKECDLYHLMEARKSQKKLTYLCHAGVAESIIPIFYDNTIIAYIIMGQYRDEAEKYTSLDKMLEATKNLDIDKQTLIENYKQLPTFSDRQLEAAFHIIDQLITLMWKNELLKPDTNSIYAKIDYYIDSHLTDKIQVEDLCSEFFMSKNTLYKMFQQNYNMPISEYIIYRRLNYSINLLKNTKLAITAISDLCGFSDSNYFTRIFKKKLGISPSTYRKQSIDIPTLTLPQLPV